MRTSRSCSKMGLGSIRQPLSSPFPKTQSRHKTLVNLHNPRIPCVLPPYKKFTPLSAIASQTPPRQLAPPPLIYSIDNRRKIRQLRDGNPNRGSR